MSNVINKIPCTICVLTRNSAKTLGEALESVKEFAEIIVCDSGSTDDTRTIAVQYGAVILDQASEFLDETGRLADYSGVRNQMLHAATHDWQFHLDSDERMSAELVREIEGVISGEIHMGKYIFMIPRQYEYKGRGVERNINYPTYQFRFFHRQHVTQFTKRIHERIRFAENERIGKLRSYKLVPIRVTAESLWKKNLIYIDTEIDMVSDVGLLANRKRLLELSVRVVLLVVRLFTRRIFRRGYKMPIAYDLNFMHYQVRLLYLVIWKKVLLREPSTE